MSPELSFTLNGVAVTVGDSVEASTSLLEVLRDRLGVRSAKDGCSPQGQCGCCTVWVDGSPRVACVTPAGRVRGRDVTTVEGLDPEVRELWAGAFCDVGASQCGFCTPGIVMRLVAHARTKGDIDEAAVDQAMLAHLCRCTGWQTIREAAVAVQQRRPRPGGRDRDAAARRAGLEGTAAQRVDDDVALGRGGFADDSAPPDALVAVLGPDGEWVVGETLTAARRAAGKVQGRRTTESLAWPVPLPAGDWWRTLQTTWVEPGYLETDAAWCRPGGDPASALGNGGAFGGKVASPVGAVARELADRYGRAVRVLWSREDAVRLGPKRPPVAIGVRPDGTGVMRAACTAGLAAAVASVAPGLALDEVDVVGPPTSSALRGAGWVEAAVVLASLNAPDEEGFTRVTAPNGAVGWARVRVDGGIDVAVSCGDVLDEVVLRSYCIGAAHMALGWVRAEGISVGTDGAVNDLTVRSFGIVRSIDMPHVAVELRPAGDEPVNGSDAVFAAVAAAVWRADDFAPRWPTSR